MADVLRKSDLGDDDYAHDEQLIKQKQQLGEWKKMQLLVDVKRKANMTDTAVQTQLNHLRGQYVELKRSTRYQQTVLLLLQELSTTRGSDRDPSHEEIAAALQAKKTTSTESVQLLKDELQDSKTHIEELADSAEKYYAEYQTLLCQMEERIRLAEDKQERVNQKQQEVQRHLAALGSTVSADDVEASLNLQTDEYKSMQETLQGVQDAMATSDLLLQKLKADCLELQQDAQDACTFLDDVRTLQNTHRGSMQAQLRWCEALQRVLETVSGVRERHVTGSSVTLELVSPPSHHQQQLTCTLTINVLLTKCANYKLQSVQVSPDTLDVNDVISTAINNNDIKFLITHIQDAWSRHTPLLQEIEALREKFALDWLQTENLLTVLFGSEASIVVQLHIEPGYPASGVVSILSAVGLPEGTTISQLQLSPSDKNSLTDWLEYLRKKLQP